MTDILDKFYSQLKELPNGCIVWTGGRHGQGYGQIYLKTGAPILTHIFAWTLEHKKRPQGDIHHKCENKLCCNPAHLEELDKWEHSALHTKQYCKYGHELAVVGRTKQNVCRECRRLSYKSPAKKLTNMLWKMRNK